MSDIEMLELYLSEMVDAFSAYAYRVEVARISMLERQILLTHSFVDPFAMGPDPNSGLVNVSFFWSPHGSKSF
jgi:hypothetical protein